MIASNDGSGNLYAESNVKHIAHYYSGQLPAHLQTPCSWLV
jgi:hypothetical protein